MSTECTTIGGMAWESAADENMRPHCSAAHQMLEIINIHMARKKLKRCGASMSSPTRQPGLGAAAGGLHGLGSIAMIGLLGLEFPG